MASPTRCPRCQLSFPTASAPDRCPRCRAATSATAPRGSFQGQPTRPLPPASPPALGLARGSFQGGVTSALPPGVDTTLLSPRRANAGARDAAAASRPPSFAAKVQSACAQMLATDPLYAPLAELVLSKGRLLGQGGMGAVYEVEDRRLGRRAALKLLTAERPSEEARARFLREARITARLDHPTIPPIYEAGRTDTGQLYMLMRLVAGETLEARLRAHHESGALPEARRALLESLVKVGEALAYAHNQGVIHRDVKPANIMIGAFGEVLLMDWGIARDQRSAESSKSLPEAPGPEPAAGSGDLTTVGAALGTPGYMPPEQADGEAIDGRADVFALGVTLSRVLTDKPNIPGNTSLEKIVATLKGDVRPPAVLDPSLPPELCWIAARALETEAEQRTESAAAMASQLQAYLARAPVPGYRYGRRERALRAARAHPARLLGLVFAAAALALLGVLRDIERRSEERQLKRTEVARSERAALAESQQQRRVVEDVERAKAHALEDAERSKKADALLVEARDMVQRGAVEALLEAKVESALRASDRDYPRLLAAAELFVDANLEAKARALLEEASEQHLPAYEALFFLHRLELGTRPFAYTKHLSTLRARAEARGDESEYSLMSEGSAALDRGDPKTALALFNRAEHYSNSFARLYANRGLAQFQLGLYDAALADFDKALASEPEDPESLVNRGAIYHLRKEHRRALEDVERAIALAPKRAEARVNRGAIRNALGDKKGALQDYDYAIAFGEQNSAAFYNRGNLYAELGRHAQALPDYDKALDLDPKQKSIYINRGLSRTATGDHEGAIADYTKALELAPRDPRTYLLRADAQAKRGALDAAEADYTEALRLDPTRSTSYVGRARNRVNRRSLDGALADAEEALKLAPGDPAGYDVRGLVRANRGDFAGALADFEEAVRLGLESMTTLANRGGARLKLGNLQGAVADFDRALALSPKNPSIAFNRAQARKLLGDLQGAIADFGVVLAARPRFSEAWRARGLARQASGDPAGALSDLKRALQLAPGAPNAGATRERIAELESP